MKDYDEQVDSDTDWGSFWTCWCHRCGGFLRKIPYWQDQVGIEGKQCWSLTWFCLCHILPLPSLIVQEFVIKTHVQAVKDTSKYFMVKLAFPQCVHGIEWSWLMTPLVPMLWSEFSESLPFLYLLFKCSTNTFVYNYFRWILQSHRWIQQQINVDICCQWVHTTLSLAQLFPWTHKGTPEVGMLSLLQKP